MGNRLSKKKKFYLALILFLIPVITYLHYLTDYRGEAHMVIAQIHYVPIIIGALAFGFKGAALTSASIILLNIPSLAANWNMSWMFLTGRGINVIFPTIFGLLIGFLMDLERKQAGELEKSRYLACLGQAGAALVHDLKNPVITIRGFARRLENGKGDFQDSARIINEAAQGIERIIESVLTFTKPITLQIQEEDLYCFVTDICKAVKARAESLEVEIIADLPKDPIKVPIDRSFLQRALINLVTNAIEASKPSQAVILSTTRVRNKAVFRIIDRGEGMDRETLKNLFTPFYSKKAKGTGLGTTIAKKIIEEHGGRIEITSQRGAGTTITVSIPFSSEKP